MSGSLTWREITAGFARGESDPVAVLESCLAVIDRRNGALNALVHVDREGARAAAVASAQRWRRGEALSPIDGLPVVVKANVAVKGMPWTAAFKPLANRIAGADADVVGDLRARGCVILGIANMHEGAMGGTTDSPLYGPCRNPLDERCVPGGSSGGSAAAVAAGMSLAAIGTDTMGSVRMPSAYCGIAGIKPSAGLLSTRGVEPLSTSLDHVGLHARCADDLRLMLAVPGTTLNEVVFIDVADLSAEHEAAMEAARRLCLARGLVVRTAALPHPDLSALRRLGLLLCEREFAAVHGAGLELFLDGVSPGFAEMVRWGVRQPAEKAERALATLVQARADARALLGDTAIAILPTARHRAFPLGVAPPVDQADLTVFANFAGLPAVNVPAPADGGLPLGLQVMAPAGRDDLALAGAAMLELLSLS